MKGIAGKNVLVTGGSSGIGQAIAVRFGQEGANVAINYRKSIEEAEKTEAMIQQCCASIEGCGQRSLLVQADVAQADQVQQMFEAMVQAFGGIDILVNNAGFQISGPSHEVPMDSFDRVMATNLRGAYLCARHAIQHFLDAGKPGSIINISSVHQTIPKPHYISYAVSKGGMQNLTTTLALEYAAQGIRVNAIGPGATVTPINRAWVDDPDKRAQVESHIPMRRAGTAEEMASATVFLASDEAGYITGQTLYVDGGLTLYPDFRTPWSSE
ncbi:MAG: glucose 1-dehydrogenase [Chloroflexaceae bacterium]|nr:glucose 1-dehydrogenase [Chloroflexaceae bacterium]